jgi:hypothetical protein
MIVDKYLSDTKPYTIIGYRITFGPNDTEMWKTSWYHSSLPNSFSVEVDNEIGLKSYPDNVNLRELKELVLDNLPRDCYHLWPVVMKETISCD